jgi:hypothetical protein
LFSKPDPEVAWLNREYIPHIAACARAILELGYRSDQSAFSLYRRYSRNLLTKSEGGSYETDVEFYDSASRIHLQIEAKAERSQISEDVSSQRAGASGAPQPANVVDEGS